MQGIASLFSLCFIAGCSERVHIETKTLAKKDNEIISYSAFRTGVDNYNIDIISKSNSDSEVVFTTYTNDAGFYSNTFSCLLKGDTVIILSSRSVMLKSGLTKMGTYVKMVSC